MRIVIAPDSFKESLSAAEAAAAIERGVLSVLPTAVCIQRPMSDGGEGFLDVIAANRNASIIPVSTVDPLGRPITSRIALLPAADDPAGGTAPTTAVVEIAHTVGLGLLTPSERNPRIATTRGLGPVLLEAARRVHPGGRILIGLGGSATNDAGTGMLHELGVRFYDASGAETEPVPEQLGRIAAIDASGLDPLLQTVTIQIACDVSNPLLGSHGASAVFGPQKGADAAAVDDLDAALEAVARAAAGIEIPGGRRVSPDAAEEPGAGAAGGLGWAMRAVLGGTMVPGLELVAQTVGLDDSVAGADLVLTGEGSIDAQTLQGKTPAGVAEAAQRHGVPCVVFAGRVHPDASVLLDHGVSALVPIVPGAMDLPAALESGGANLEHAAAMVLQLMTARSRTSPGADRAKDQSAERVPPPSS